MRKSITICLLLLPATLIQLWIMFTGIFSSIEQSLGYIPTAGLTEISRDYYRELLADPTFWRSLLFSLYTALFSSGLSVGLGLGLAGLMAANFPARFSAQQWFKLPIIVPHLVAVFLIMVTLGNAGLVDRLLHFAWGPGVRSPNLTMDPWGLGIILTYIWKSAPYAAFILYTFLRNTDPRLISTARNLGASPWRAFWHVLVPLLKPALGGCFILIFAYNFTAFEVPFLIGPTYPKALPVLAYTYFLNPDSEARAYAMAINSLLLLFSLFPIWFFQRCWQSESKEGR